MAVVAFTANLQRHVPSPTVTAEGTTVREVLERVFADNPRLRSYVVDEHGVLRKHMAVFVDGKHLVDHDLLANVRSNLFYFNFFASSNTILFAAGFYDRVHVDLFNLSPADGFPQSPIV